jgi:hypothetical protein
MKLFDLFPPILDLRGDEYRPSHSVSALHSGNLGDLIYSLPTAYALGVTHYVLNICSDPTFGGRNLTREGALKLAPLLVDQGPIRRVSVIQSHVPFEYAEPAKIGVDHVLDAFRQSWVELPFHLMQRHAIRFGIRVDGSRPWLTSEPCQPEDLPEGIRKPYVVVGLTSRYRRWGGEYYASLLRDFPADRSIFVGVEEDLVHKRDIPGAFLKATDFKVLARILAGASLFIGNPSFPYALAEALKVPRLVELPEDINVAPLDPSGLALHLHSEESLRRKIFQAIKGAVPRESSTPESIDEVKPDLADMDRQRHLLESRINELNQSLVMSRAASIRWTEEECRLSKEIELFHNRLESPGFLMKSLFRVMMLSNPLTGSLHVKLSRNPRLRRLWRSLGSV